VPQHRQFCGHHWQNTAFGRTAHRHKHHSFTRSALSRIAILHAALLQTFTQRSFRPSRSAPNTNPAMPPSSRPTAFALVSATVLVSATRIRLVSATVPPSLLASLRDAFRLRNPRDSSSLPPCDSMRLCAYALSAHLPLVPQKSFPNATTKVCCHIATIKLLFTSTEPFAPQAVAAARACTCARAVLAPISTSAPRTHALASSQSIQHRSMQGPQYAMLVHLAMMLSTVHGWVLPSDDKAHDSSLSSHESAITGGVDGVSDRRQLRKATWIASSCDGGWSAPRPRPRAPPLLA
jgi:hypothetical protein